MSNTLSNFDDVFGIDDPNMARLKLFKLRYFNRLAARTIGLTKITNTRRTRLMIVLFLRYTVSQDNGSVRKDHFDNDFRSK